MPIVSIERGRHRVAAAIAVQDRIAPPLQADLAERRLADRVADARDLGVEGVQREEMRARRLRREEVGEVAVAVGASRTMSAAVGVGIHRRRR